MKNAVIYLLVLTVFFSCEKLDEVSAPPSNSELEGKWELQNANCFCFFSEDFDFAAHYLTFNASVNEVFVENSEDTFFVKTTGTYPIITTNEHISFADGIQYAYKIKEGTLTLTFVDNPQIADDEISLIYLKI